VDKISAKADESLHRPAENAATGLHRVETLHAWRLKGILRRKPVERGKLGLLGDADGPLPLHIRVATHRKNADAGFPDIAAHE